MGQHGTQPPTSQGELHLARLLQAVVPPCFQLRCALGPRQNTLHKLFLLKLSNMWVCCSSQQGASPNSLDRASGAARSGPLCCVSLRTVAG